MRRIACALLIIALGIIAGCSSSDSIGGTSTATHASSTTSPSVTTATSLPPAFTGSVRTFYQPPSPLPEAQPGTLIRYQATSSKRGETTWRIMYHSVDAAGRDQPVTGTITFPTSAPPEGGWPVISIGPGTVGLHSRCAISRGDGPVDDFGIGAVAVRTDYIGMVEGQLQRYLSGVSEAHSVIDAVRAARNIPAARAGKRWVAFGHSQGGHSALFTNQLARSWAPELDLLGSVVGAPAAELTRTFGPDDQVIPHVVELLGLFGIAADHPGTDPISYLSSEAKRHIDVLKNDCMDRIIPTFAPLAANGLFSKDPTTTEPAASLVRRNNPGKVAAPSPILLFEGSEDRYVVPARAQATRRRLCSVGQTTQYLLLPGANHSTEIARGHSRISSWIADRFADEPAPDNCPGN